ncbi:MAG TPA: type II toxin-antitoxin system RelE/ParE family toxin, partial [Chthoniobacteraceae bacterium]|nr:type II toxin-antitoxin system RelE/ParE family toxin [Chthoniobacteraceae bacterium]
QDYWERRGEAWRGEKYFGDLTRLAHSELTDPARARRGRLVEIRDHPDAREILAFGVYRIIYRIDEIAGIVNVLRLWHAHRDEPRREA